MIKKVVLGDLFIGDYKVSQRFGARPWAYLRYRWKGHNGVDFACPQGTQLVAPVTGTVIVSRSDPKGWGEYVYIWDKDQNAIYLAAHMVQRQVKEGQHISIGQRIGLSGSTGNSTGAHLHAGLYRCTDYGVKVNTLNGFGGGINILDPALVKWDLKNIKVPV